MAHKHKQILADIGEDRIWEISYANILIICLYKCISYNSIDQTKKTK